MTLASNQLKTEIVYPDSDGKPMAESDPARDYLIYGVSGLDLRELRFYHPPTEKTLLSHKETEQARQAAEQARLDAIPKLLELGLSLEQVANTLSLSVDEVRSFALE
ncbi:hypothetical protein NIES2100_55300 [Calothrix sp. NIES-2100]|uniref:hypothetical protein n=1 Tax=Calothrix sp. NIES-2100 TaxID=1954172 RepID=UPI000B5FF555|nr:hypothetical protein NIES2100_55300 [Calothrix sp. NIES-2100]